MAATSDVSWVGALWEITACAAVVLFVFLGAMWFEAHRDEDR